MDTTTKHILYLFSYGGYFSSAGSQRSIDLSEIIKGPFTPVMTKSE